MGPKEAAELKRGTRVYTVVPWLTRQDSRHRGLADGELIKPEVVGALTIGRMPHGNSLLVVFDAEKKVTDGPAERFFLTEADALNAAIEHICQIQADLGIIRGYLSTRLAMPEKEK